MIRKANFDDITEIYKLGNQFNDNFTKINDIEADLKSTVKKIYVYEKNKKAVAFIILSILDCEIEILDLFVNSNYRQMGIANEILNYIFSKYKMNYFLEVNVNNKPAIKLYEKNNFKIINIRKNYYENTCDAFVMKRGE